MNQASELSRSSGINRVSCGEYLRGKTDPFEKSGKIQKDLTDCLLSILARSVPPGVKMSCREIADFCGISKQRIHQIEQEALKKLRGNETITRKEFKAWQ
tara:strand:- start:204 stop:503 length:300 start_codon:yes stop_codon:yes gene_type:complete